MDDQFHVCLFFCLFCCCCFLEYKTIDEDDLQIVFVWRHPLSPECKNRPLSLACPHSSFSISFPGSIQQSYSHLWGTYIHYLHWKLLCCWVSTMFYPYLLNIKGLYISGKPARLGHRESMKAISEWQQSSLPFRRPKGTDLSCSLSCWILFCLFYLLFLV